MVDFAMTPELKHSLEGRWEPLYRSQLHYLVTWGTRGRKPVLRDRHMRALQDLIQSLCDERGHSLLEVAAAPDHVHVLFALRPSQSVATMVRELKGRCGPTLLDRFPELRVWLRGNLLWDERYTVETVSSTRLDAVQLRLRTMHGSSDSFAQAS
jgi:putative transposase